MEDTKQTFDLVPAELKKIPQWVCWNDVEKKPKDVNGKLIAWTGKTEFHTFEQVTATDMGIGFFFTEGDCYMGVDLDGCRNKQTGFIEPWAENIIHTLASYTEVSPSETGVKIICRGKSPFDRGKNTKLNIENKYGKEPGIEIYDHARYFTITGDILSEDFTEIAVINSEKIRELYDELPKLKDQRGKTNPGDRRGAQCPDVKASTTPIHADQVIERARKYLAKIDPAISGQNGHTQTFYVACKLVHGYNLTPDQAFPLMMEYSDRCEPPWSEYEIRHKLDSANSQEDNEGRPRGYLIGETVRTTGGVKTTLPATLRNLTDLGNAERLVHRHGDLIRYCFTWRKWMVYRHGCWQIDEKGTVSRLAGLTVRSIPKEGDGCEREVRAALGKWSLSSESAVRLNAMVTLAQSQLPIATDEFEQHPWLLNSPNGTIDLRSAELRRHDPEDFMLSVTGAKFDDTAQCPMWKAFLNRIMDGNAELINYLQTLAGYWATGVIREHVLPVFYGKGGNGKSVFLNTIQNVLGDYTMKCGKSFLMSTKHEQHPTATADLFRKRLAIAIETDEGRRLDEALVKELTGGDRVRARRMREDFWEFEPTHKIVLCTNHKPRVSGTDDGIWRRIQLVPFTVQIPGDEQDKELTEKLKSEASGILNWIIVGSVNWQADGLPVPSAIDNATKVYREESDTLGQFIDECCVIHPDSKVKASELFKSYQAWDGKLGQKNFGLQMSERFKKHKAGGVIVYDGLGLKAV